MDKDELVSFIKDYVNKKPGLKEAKYQELADQFKKKGIRTPRGQPFTPGTVKHLYHYGDRVQSKESVREDILVWIENILSSKFSPEQKLEMITYYVKSQRG
jgi:hypothetical protein